jgi:predicted nucleic acid-binding Zn ribbon protein
MARGAAAGAVYTTARACELCGAGLPAGSSVNRLYCDACRARRRIRTFLMQAQLIAAEELSDRELVAEIADLVARVGGARKDSRS